MSRITTCPHCSTRLSVPEGITDKTLICPHCLANVDNVWPGDQIRASNIDTNVKRDLSVGSIVLAVLIGLCILGIVLEFFALHNTNTAAAGLFFLAITCFALEILVSIAIVRWGSSRVRVSPVAATLGIIFLLLGTSVAICIFFFVTCLNTLIHN